MFECISSEGELKEGKISYDNGDIYQGQVHNTFLVPLGSGTLTCSNVEHSGLFRNGVFRYGVSTFKNGTIYNGSW
jgi:hypothetical protein